MDNNAENHIIVPHHEVQRKLDSYIGCITKVRISFPERRYTASLSDSVLHPTSPQFQLFSRNILVFLTSKYINQHLSCKNHIARSRLFLFWLEQRLNNWSETLTEENARIIFREYLSSLRAKQRSSNTKLSSKAVTLLQGTAKIILDNYLNLDRYFLIDGTALLRTNQAATNSYTPPLLEDAEKAFKFYLKNFNGWLTEPENNTTEIPTSLPNFIHYFFYLFQAITGMNFAQAQQVTITMLEEASRLSNETRDPRLKTIKARAGYIEQEFEYPLWFNREVVVKYLNTVNGYSGRVINISDFISAEQPKDTSYDKYHHTSKKISGSSNIPYIRSSEWRKFKGHFVSKRFGHTVSAMISQHSEETAHRHYRTINEVEAQTEMGEFFRFQEDLHNLIEKGSMGKSKQDIPAGGCDAESSVDRPDHLKPKQQSFYVGDCKTPAGCLFCTHYVVHADPEDFWKLESLRFYISELALRQSNIEHVEEVHGSILSRVEDILTTLAKKPEGVGLWNEAKEKIARKNLHPVWKRLLTTQIKLGRLDS